MQNKLKYILILLLFILLSSAYLSIYAQTNFSARLDTNRIRIGEQTKIILSATVAQGNSVYFPVFKDTINEKIELIKVSKIDTAINDGFLTLSQQLIITSFDSGYWAIKPFVFLLNKDSSKTFETEALLLTVNTVDVDTTKAIKPIKQPLDVPWHFKEFLPYIFGGIILVAIIIAAIYFIRKRKKKMPEKIVAAPLIPAHEKALKKLKEIEEQKLWQNNMIKEYYSGISETLREYIEDRFKIKALEQTTDQTKKSFRHVTVMDQEIKNKLFSILELADMVKFAKEIPIQQEHEMSMNNAVEFVTITVEKNENENTNQNNKS